VADKVVLIPEQIGFKELDKVIVGLGDTLIFMVLVPKQPVPFVPFTVNIVEERGETTTEEPLNPPGFQV
jgi:hypothetical protein